jgi:FlaG/FlaF family flagellin (archaellin)
MLNKRGLSEVVGYVLLISISFALAGMVFSWLKFYVTPGEEITCDEGVSIAIRAYNYSCETRELNITLKNDGRFDIDGYIVRVNNRSGETKIGVYTINKTGRPLPVGNTSYEYHPSVNDISGKPITGITFVEVQPFTIQQGTTIYCEDVSKHTIRCS